MNKQSSNELKVSFILLIATFFFSPTSHGGTIVYSFNPAEITVVQGESIYTFPKTVFQSQFGQIQVGSHVYVDNQYRGFLIGQVTTAVKENESVTESLTGIYYGDLVYYQQGPYYFLGSDNSADIKTLKTTLSPKDIKYAWVVPKEPTNKNLKANSSSEGSYFHKGKNGEIRVKGEALRSENLGVIAVKVGEKIYYVDKKTKPEEHITKHVSLILNERQILWVANR